MIKFLSKLPLFKKIYRQGGIDAFPLAQKDIMDTMAEDLDIKAEELAKKKLNYLLSPIDHSGIASITKQGVIYVGGERPDDGRLANLKSEAEFLMQSDIWKLLQETPKKLAEQAMFVAGESLDDMKKGRSILYTLSSQQRIVDILKSYQPKPKEPPLAPVDFNK
jgi:hypothetical protein